MKRKKIGEIKHCTTCDKEYEHFSTNRYSLCKECRIKQYLQRNRLKPEDHKKHYPLDSNEKKKRYTKLRRALDKCYHREEWLRLIRQELENIEQNGIMLWCMDRRVGKPKAEMEHGVKGRKPKDKTDSRIKYPDTRSWYE